MAVEARTFPEEIQKSFGDLPPSAVGFLKTLAVKFEPFGVPLKNNRDQFDIRGFEMLAYGPQGESYGQLLGLARNAGVSEAILGIALFKVAFLSAEALVKTIEGQVHGSVVERLVFTFNIDAQMLSEPRLEKIVTQLLKPSFQVLLEASENLKPGHVEPLVSLLQARASWLNLALDDANDLHAGTRLGLMHRIELVKADGRYVRRLHDNETYLKGTMLPKLVELRQDQKPFVAEGIETPKMKDFLLDNWNVSAHGELWMQGYHIQVPAPWDQVLCPLNPDPIHPKAYVLPKTREQSGVSPPGSASVLDDGIGGGTPKAETAPVVLVNDSNPTFNPNRQVAEWLANPEARPFLQNQMPAPWDQVLCPLNPDPIHPKAYVLPKTREQSGVSPPDSTSVLDDGIGGGIPKAETAPVVLVNDSNQKFNPNRQVAEWLANPEARPFLQKLVTDIRGRFPTNIQDDDAAAVVEFFARCPLPDVKNCFWSVLAVANVVSGQPAPEMRQAILGVFLLLAVRLVNQSVGQIKGHDHARKVASADPNICAVVVSSMIGGELCFKRDDHAGLWVPKYIFHIHESVAGDDYRNAFLRQVFQRVVEGTAGDRHIAPPPTPTGGINEVVASREDRALSEDEMAWLKMVLGLIGHSLKLTVGLVAHPSTVDDAMVASIAQDLAVPVLKIDGKVPGVIVEMSEADLIVRFQQLWATLDPPPPRDSAAKASVVPASLEQPPASAKHGAKSDSQGARPLATTIQEAGKTVAASREIAGLFAKAYNTLAPLIGLPPLP